MQDFFTALWPGFSTPGNVTLWLNPSRASLHVPLADLATVTDADIAELAEENAKHEAIYFGLGLRRDGLPIEKQGGKQDVIALPGFALDIDIFHKTAHAADNLPPDEDAAYAIIADAPDPSLIVHTGYGWHCYWLFQQAMKLANASQRTVAQKLYKAFQQPFIDRAASMGWHVDSTATIQRVWRVPGFNNWKLDASPAPVVIRHSDPATRYEPEPLVNKITSGAIPAKTDPGRDTGSAAKLSAGGTSASTVPASTSGSLAPVAASLSTLSPGSPNKALIDLVLAGKSFADEGMRDIAMQRVCSSIGFSDPARHMAPEVVAEILRPSLSVWAAEPGATKTVDEEIEKAIDKIARAQQDWRDQQERQRTQLEGLARSIRRSAGNAKPGEDTFEFVSQFAIIQRRSTYYVYNFGGQKFYPQPERYSHPLIEKEVLVYARDAWEAAPALELVYYNDKEQEKQKTLSRVLNEYCTEANEVIGDMTLPSSDYDPAARVFREAVCPLRDLEPLFDPQIHEWLCLLAGEHVEKVLDWIATVTLLEHQSCALYLSGVSGAGKGLLASGLSRLWRIGGPSNMANVLGDFNADMFQCPLVVLDEGLPKRKGDLSAQIRALIGTSLFTRNEKYMATTTVYGSVRAMITANNEEVLALGDEDMSLQDLEAVAGRFLHVHARREAADWLREHNPGNALTVRWVNEDLIARHALWLRDNRVVIPGKRFIVEGEQTDMHRRLVMQGNVPGLVFEWLARYATTPGPLDTVYKTKKEEPLARVGGGEILVNTQAVVDGWDLYMKDDYKRPTTQRISRILSRLSDGKRRVGTKERKWLHNVKQEFVLGWAREHQVGDEDQMQANIARPIKAKESDASA